MSYLIKNKNNIKKLNNEIENLEVVLDNELFEIYKNLDMNDKNSKIVSNIMTELHYIIENLKEIKKAI